MSLTASHNLQVYKKNYLVVMTTEFTRNTLIILLNPCPALAATELTANYSARGSVGVHDTDGALT